MLKVVIIGTGKVAQHLFDALISGSVVKVVQVIGRRPDALHRFKNVTTGLMADGPVLQADVYIIAVSDGAIAEVAQLLKPGNGLVVHTSGGIPIDDLLSHERRGVFYPLQTFSSDRAVDFGKVPICIEARYPKDLELLHKLASSISSMIYEIDTAHRKHLHVAAVFANNFTNHMYVLANQICEENGLPFDMLKPLILETAKKIEHDSPLLVQTGPAIRHDAAVMQLHAELLGTGTRRAIYELISKSIQNKKHGLE
jgi:predicted short-subunit dehydrogenase-like oxidoreductase (DUF2520 family)